MLSAARPERQVHCLPQGTRTLQPDIVIYFTGTLTTIPFHKISYLSVMWVTLLAAPLDVLVRHLHVRVRK